MKQMFKDKPLTIGFSFGLASGIITTLGMIIGLESALESKLIIITGILSVAVADAFSDGFGIYISQEAVAIKKKKNIRLAAVYTSIFKFVFASLFAIPFLLFGIQQAIILSLIYAGSVISIYSYLMAKKQNRSPWKHVSEHLLIAFIVVVITHYAGDIVRSLLS